MWMKWNIRTVFLPLIAWFILFPFNSFFHRYLALSFLFLFHVALNLRAVGRKSKPTLVGLPISHYTEKVRWALDILEVDYDEERHHAVLGVLLEGRMVPTLRINTSSVSDSADILQFLAGKYPNHPFLQGDEKALALQEKFDNVLGRHIRRWLYTLVFEEDASLGMFLWGDRIEPWQKAIQPYGLYQVCRFLIGRLLKLGRKGAAESLVKVRGVFEEVEDILKDGRRFLCGHQFTVADIAFCSLVAPLLAPEQYGGTSLPLDKFPKEAKEVRDELLKGAIGKYVMRVYKDKRPTKKKDN
eukprot:TRINITY_DN13458_c0_g2_i4.p1 TRINITY_DN13458_c0_g2~~TRINITY_DN13458_c0_g2_i4.p1  ORF type:complete len:308 (-),score=70.25 TRINITY_DN13458_c0_g2_i4:228-1124(-)